MSNRIITISRQFGSGGRTIGKEVAARLGIPCYDNELLEKIAEESGFTKEYIAEKGEYASHGSWLVNAFSDRNFNHYSNQDYLWIIQRKLILELAQKGPCVIVGRCADYLLKDTHDCLTVFIHSDIENRAKRIVEQYGQQIDSPEKRLRDKDKRRAAYYQFYTDQKWGAAQNYHIVLNSGVLGIEKCVDILVELYTGSCPRCKNHCSKDNLQCHKGKEYFGITTEESKEKHHELSKEATTPDEKVIELLRKSGHYLHHSVGHNDSTDPSQLLSALSAEEKTAMISLLEKCLQSWKS
ncbi:MAG: cytidylate kinase-like family protein [Lachnospiraceae bacterium]|nr:cytidylate kinase-like family protein [Lachnospiraceae bacterium]